MRHRELIHKVSVLEILDKSFSIYLENMESFFAVFLLLNVINAILVYAISPLIPPFNPPYESTEKIFSWLISYGVHIITILCFLFLISWMIMNVGNSLIIKFVSDIFEGKKPSVRESFISALHLSGRVLAASFITGTLMILGFILLIFPGLIMTVIFSLVVPAIILENLGVFDGLRRSKELTNNMWMKTFLLLFAFFIMLITVYLLIEALTLSFYRFYQQIWVKNILKVVLLSVVEPIYPISITQLYYISKRQKITIPPMETREEYAIYSPPSRSEIKFCYYCGQILPYDAIYCPNCGRKIRFFTQ